MPDVKRDLELIHDATGRLVRTVDGFSDEDWHRPSGLPDWTRAHVAAHLALNAEALTGILEGLARDKPVPMYRSGELRDRDDRRARGGRAVGDPRPAPRLTAGVPDRRCRTLPADSGKATACGLPTGPRSRGRRSRPCGCARSRSTTPTWMRVTGAHDWPAEFVVELLDAVTVDHAGSGPFRVEATDLDPPGSWRRERQRRTVVTGRGADLGWWLTGRGRGDGLRVDADDLPEDRPMATLHRASDRPAGPRTSVSSRT